MRQRFKMWTRSRTILSLIGALTLALMVAFLLLHSTLQQALEPGIISDGPPRQSQATASASDWPHLRGPNYDAVSTDTRIAETWPPSGPPILWTRDFGQGYSGFAVVDERAYTQMQSLAGQYLVCLNADTGATIWQYRYDWPWQPASTYPGPYATPTFHEGRIYFTSPAGIVGCVDADNGTSLWSVNVVKKFAGQGFDFGYACTPLVESGKVILPAGGENASVIALNTEDGALVWKSGDDPASYSSALPFVFRGRRYVVVLLRNVFVVLDPESGQIIWKQQCSVQYDEHSAWPLYVEPRMLIAAPFRAGAQAYRFEADAEKIAAKLAWHSPKLSNDICSSLIVGDHVYGFDLKDYQAKAHRPSRGEFRCLELATGKVCWSTDRTGHATVIGADGKLILFNDTGTLILARATPLEYEELSRTTLLTDGLCWTQPALSRGRLFVRNQSRAACVYLGKPAHLSPELHQKTLSVADIPQSKRIDWDKLFPQEPEFPFDAPTGEELSSWFIACFLGVFGSGAVAAGCVYLLMKRMWPIQARRGSQITFWSLSFLLGLAGTSVFSRAAEAFLLTWPVCLFIGFQVTLISITWAEQQPDRKRSRRVSRITTLLFLAICLGYFELCKIAGVVMGWGFLIGFLPAWPAALRAARSQNDGKPIWLLAFWMGLAFTIYFWTSGLLPGWKMYLGRLYTGS